MTRTENVAMLTSTLLQQPRHVMEFGRACHSGRSTCQRPTAIGTITGQLYQVFALRMVNYYVAGVRSFQLVRERDLHETRGSDTNKMSEST